MRPAQGPPLPGVAAKWPGVCPICDRAIHMGDRIAFRRGEYIHCTCAAGAEDE